jgi:hypothetical protein
MLIDKILNLQNVHNIHRVASNAGSREVCFGWKPSVDQELGSVNK